MNWKMESFTKLENNFIIKSSLVLDFFIAREMGIYN